jgi:hypothetical protein
MRRYIHHCIDGQGILIIIIIIVVIIIIDAG